MDKDCACNGKNICLYHRKLEAKRWSRKIRKLFIKEKNGINTK